MAWVVLNFHRTEPAPAPGQLHTVADAEFDAHLESIAQSRLPVASARDLLAPTRDAAARSVILTFDDASASDLRNAHKLAARGWKAVFFVPTALVGSPGHLSWHEVRELDALGMEIGSHSHQHRPLTDVNLETAEAELKQSRVLLEQNLGKPVDLLAWPGGRYNRQLQALALGIGFRALWTTRWGSQRGNSAAALSSIRRNNVVQHAPRAHFEAVLAGRNEYRRRAANSAMELMKATLSETTYHRLRALVVNLRHG